MRTNRELTTRPAGATARGHWAEYACEAAALGSFMVSAGVVTIALQLPASPLASALPDPTLRLVLTGIAMGLTAIAIVYSPIGRRSGAHMNPVLTLTFLRLGKIAPRDAAGYIAAQVLGALLGLWAVGLVSWAALADPAVDFVRTRPGPRGVYAALVAEAAISFGMMLTVLTVSNSRHHRLTGVCAGVLVAIYISLEAPISGMSMNPARSLAPAVLAGSFDSFWIYVAGPLSGMLPAAELFTRLNGAHAVACAKLHHDHRVPCIFRCVHGTTPLPVGRAVHHLSLHTSTRGIS